MMEFEGSFLFSISAIQTIDREGVMYFERRSCITGWQKVVFYPSSGSIKHVYRKLLAEPYINC